MGKLFTASELAGFCDVDLKTIHNWCDRGRVEHFRTPGRHLRFKPRDVKAFLEAYKYDVPAEVEAAANAEPAPVETTVNPA